MTLEPHQSSAANQTAPINHLTPIETHQASAANLTAPLYQLRSNRINHPLPIEPY